MHRSEQRLRISAKALAEAEEGVEELALDLEKKLHTHLDHTRTVVYIAKTKKLWDEAVTKLVRKKHRDKFDALWDDFRIEYRDIRHKGCRKYYYFTDNIEITCLIYYEDVENRIGITRNEYTWDGHERYYFEYGPIGYQFTNRDIASAEKIIRHYDLNISVSGLTCLFMYAFLSFEFPMSDLMTNEDHSRRKHFTTHYEGLEEAANLLTQSDE